MGDLVDLHIHSSNSSDGDVPPLRLVELAAQHQLRAVSISDHDTVASYPEVLDYGAEAGIEVIPGMELTTLFEGREFHLLLPFVDWRSEKTADLIKSVSDSRFLEAGERVDRLQRLGFEIEWEEVLKYSAPFPPLGVTIAQVLLQKADKSHDKRLKKYFRRGLITSAVYAFYRDYFMEGKPASVPRRSLLLLDVLKDIAETGGVPVLAHPGAPFQNTTGIDLEKLTRNGLQGLEVFSSYHSPSQIRKYRKSAIKFGLVATAGSDFHGSFKPHISFGSVCGGNYRMVEELRERRA